MLRYNLNRKNLEYDMVRTNAFVFSNARRVLSQCNSRLTLLYLLNNKIFYEDTILRYFVK